MFIDSHAHVTNFYYENIEDIVSRAKEKNVLKIINCATGFDDFDEIIRLSDMHGFYFVLGIHPENIKNVSLDYLKKLERYIKKSLNNPRFIGMGEIGLDYYYDKESIEDQKKIFENQLIIAQKYNLPVIIHSRNSTSDIIRILEKYNLKGIVHCFSGSRETAKKYIELGYKIGIGGLVTFKNCNLKEDIAAIGIKNIVLETDCPYMTPEPFRSQKNEPSYIPVIAEFISKTLDLTTENVGEITSSNCDEIFDFKSKK